jgi:hypothetical protein
VVKANKDRTLTDQKIKMIYHREVTHNIYNREIVRVHRVDLTISNNNMKIVVLTIKLEIDPEESESLVRAVLLLKDIKEGVVQEEPEVDKLLIEEEEEVSEEANKEILTIISRGKEDRIKTNREIINSKEVEVIQVTDKVVRLKENPFPKINLSNCQTWKNSRPFKSKQSSQSYQKPQEHMLKSFKCMMMSL